MEKKNFDINEMITDRMIEQLEQGVIPWRKPWTGAYDGAYNRETGRAYSLINQMLLKHPGEYATFNQWKAAGGTIKKGSKSEVVVFWKVYERETTNADGKKEIKRFPCLRYYRVFHISQVDGVEPKSREEFQLKTVSDADALISGYVHHEGIRFVEEISNRACYSPSSDKVIVPQKSQFDETVEWYSTAFHELTHSTGHESRLNRDTLTKAAAFGSEEYSKEELIAEMGAASLMHLHGIETPDTFENSAAYLQSWLDALKADSKMIVSAAGKAEKAVEYICENVDEIEAAAVDDTEEIPAVSEIGSAEQLSLFADDSVPETVPAEKPETEAAEPEKNPLYYSIDETLARAAHNAMSFSDYVASSATTEYRGYVDKAAALVAKQKQKVSPFYHEKLDNLLNRYARRLADWTNAHNRNVASCPSILIAGGSNFPVNKKRRQNNRENRLWQEYKEIESLLDNIRSIGTGPIDLNDPHARELLTERLQKLQSEHETGKHMNAYWKKHGNFSGFPGMTKQEAAAQTAKLLEIMERFPPYNRPYPAFHQASVRGKIERVKARLAELDKLEAAKAQPQQESAFSGGHIVRNAELNRLQIIFDGKPEAETRTALKSEGFRWSPKNKAWQRQLTKNAEHALNRLLEIIDYAPF
ncbi:MAG: ssDNA-binding domain-containing protein [Clostridia bacterium]|nr:ssDNA-binding domain-containing protein [Clostridia bacterium]